MKHSESILKHVQYVTDFENLLSTQMHGEVNAMCWERNLKGDFSEIVNNFQFDGNLIEIHPDEIRALQLSENGSLAREIILSDLKTLKEHGAAPVLNIIKSYEKDLDFPYFPTDVYSFHVDRSPIATNTFLCTYFGDSSEIISNSQAIQKIQIPEIRTELKKLFQGNDEDFELFLTEHFFDLHYQANKDATPFQLGNGHLWKLAIDHPNMNVLPSIHRAPFEKSGNNRLLLIC